jgi:hypothetical protein
MTENNDEARNQRKQNPKNGPIVLTRFENLRHSQAGIAG